MSGASLNSISSTSSWDTIETINDGDSIVIAEGDDQVLTYILDKSHVSCIGVVSNMEFHENFETVHQIVVRHAIETNLTIDEPLLSSEFYKRLVVAGVGL